MEKFDGLEIRYAFDGWDEPLIEGLIDKTVEVTDETKALLIKVFDNSMS